MLFASLLFAVDLPAADAREPAPSFSPGGTCSAWPVSSSTGGQWQAWPGLSSLSPVDNNISVDKQPPNGHEAVFDSVKSSS